MNHPVHSQTQHALGPRQPPEGATGGVDQDAALIGHCQYQCIPVEGQVTDAAALQFSLGVKTSQHLTISLACDTATFESLPARLVMSSCVSVASTSLGASGVLSRVLPRNSALQGPCPPWEYALTCVLVKEKVLVVCVFWVLKREGCLK
ncbi:hypothetical protein E2C01_091090 [Portunus trituberculatus]|uniref:Uncharacterized protein n=1 Tax=Portunus trituberculatus TaxID=210409 RepID=A0A5B7JD33_PORTR|nr:hypothetical protein [Portunus trituberculatus]